MIDAAFWVDIAWKVWTVGLTFYVAINRGHSRLSQRLDDIEQKQSAAKEQTTRLEGEIAKLPTMREMGEIHEKINEVAKDLAKLTGTLESNEMLLRAVHQKLMH